MTVFGMLRVKNECRWIKEVLESILPLCERIFVLDDHSDDITPEICEKLDERITVYRSQFVGLDETRDKNFLLSQIMSFISEYWLRGSETSPYWILAIDGDEILSLGSQKEIKRVLASTSNHAFTFPIRYLWNSKDKVRVDGVYKNFARPSLFRLMNKAFTFRETPWGGNFHCSSIPQELLHLAHLPCGKAEILHFGYLDRADRVRKFNWYNSIDPNNAVEDCYRHMVIGDIFPKESKFKWAGPLELEAISSALCVQV